MGKAKAESGSSSSLLNSLGLHMGLGVRGCILGVFITISTVFNIFSKKWFVFMSILNFNFYCMKV